MLEDAIANDSTGNKTASLANYERCYDDFKLNDPLLSCMHIKFLPIVSFNKKIDTRSSHPTNYNNFHVQVLLT